MESYSRMKVKKILNLKNLARVLKVIFRISNKKKNIIPYLNNSIMRILTEQS